MSNFNRIAPVYDTLSAFIFGKQISLAKKYYVGKIPPGAKVLILGGGTGVLLNEILKRIPEVKIDFIEPAEKFIRLAKKKLLPPYSHQVNFIRGNHGDIPSGKTYDVLITMFVVDCFKQEDALAFCRKALASLRVDGLWLFADFVKTSGVFNNTLISMMYKFFRAVADIQAVKLPDYNAIFSTLNIQTIETKTFFRGMIKAILFKIV